jgi:hypothetical protein
MSLRFYAMCGMSVRNGVTVASGTNISVDGIRNELGLVIVQVAFCEKHGYYSDATWPWPWPC